MLSWPLNSEGANEVSATEQTEREPSPLEVRSVTCHRTIKYRQYIYLPAPRAAPCDFRSDSRVTPPPSSAQARQCTPTRTNIIPLEQQTPDNMNRLLRKKVAPCRRRLTQLSGLNTRDHCPYCISKSPSPGRALPPNTNLLLQY